MFYKFGIFSTLFLQDFYAKNLFFNNFILMKRNHINCNYKYFDEMLCGRKRLLIKFLLGVSVRR